MPKPKTLAAKELLQIDQFEDRPTEKAPLPADDISYIISQAHKYPVLSVKDELVLAKKIHQDKLMVLMELSQDPLFFAYLADILPEQTKRVKKLEVKVEELDDEQEEEVEEAELSLLQNKKYMDSLRQIIKVGDQLFFSTTEEQLAENQAQLLQLFEQVNFVWTKLRKDKVMELLEKDNPHLLQLKRDLDTLIYHNILLVVSVARQYHRPGKFGDSIQVGFMGLIVAAERFDYRRGNKFSTYAVWWIKQAVKRFNSQFVMIRLPVHLADKLSAMAMLRRKSPLITNEEIAEMMNVPLSKIELWDTYQRSTKVVSLDAPMSEDSEKDSDSLLYTVRDKSDSTEVRASQEIAHIEILDLLQKNLSPREYMIFTRKFGLVDEPEETLEEIGQRLSLSRERIRQILDKIIAKMLPKVKAYLSQG